MLERALERRNYSLSPFRYARCRDDARVAAEVRYSREQSPC